MQGYATIQIAIRFLLVRKLNIATYGTASHFFGAAIGRFHDTGAAPGHDGEAQPRDRCAHLARQFIWRAPRGHARGTENGDARTDEVEDAKPAQEIPHYAQECDELVKARTGTFQENLIGAFRGRGQGRP
jgi:hypothetical protein